MIKALFKELKKDAKIPANIHWSYRVFNELFEAVDSDGSGSMDVSEI